MRTATARLKSSSPYSQSRHYDVPKKPKESPKDYEERTWRERCHADSTGKIIIPPMAFKSCIEEVSKYLGERIPGRGTSTYSKHFSAGLLVVQQTVLPLKKDDVPGEWLFVPSDGKKGGGKRVMKCFPVIHEWQAEVEFMVLDSTITNEVFEHHLREAGNFIGIGRFRPIRGGYYGRFVVQSVKWSE